jgi:acetoin utilization deacetylase AcuC-like enzyme
MVGYLHHDLFVKHLEGYPHVESPGRLLAIMQRIKKSPIVSSLRFIEAEPAERSWIERVHDRGYVEGILSLEIEDAVMLDWGDTVATPASPQAALHAAGAGVQAARMVLSGELPTAFCAVRPPGHHAERNRAMGFCIFNNIAIAAADLIEEGGLERVSIVDWDVHHGNGTESIFIEDEKVQYVSLHQYPHYPGTGHAETVGLGRGAGFNLNIPMGTGAGDSEYLEAFEKRVIPALDAYKPQFILISAGFDGHGDDPLSGTLLTSGAYGEMTRLLKGCAARHCEGRIISMLEGGYDLEALAESVESHLTALDRGR